MKKIKQIIKITIVIAALLVPMMWSAQAFAGGVSLTLVRVGSLVNVYDAAGLWQHEGGNVLKSGVTIGKYALHRRVTTNGTSSLNTAMVTATLFFSAYGSPPQNITLQGAHNFTNGRFVGSVGAASNRYNWVQGSDATIIPTATIGTSTLTVFWTGASQLTLP